MNINKPFAEVIESSLDTFLAQCWEWNIFPKFGSLVFIQEKQQIILGCVTAIQTGSMDPLRSPFPYQKTEEELQAEQPQLFEFLKTTFTVKVLGYKQEKITRYLLPPHPAKIHAFVKTAPIQLSIEFFSVPDFLYLLFSAANTIIHFDDLLLAIVKQHNLEPMLNTLCQTLSLLTGNDYRRIKLFLKRAESLL